MSDTAISAAEQRERTYRFLAGLCLKPPSEPVVSMIRDGSILSLFEHEDKDGPGFEWMSEFLRQARESSQLKQELEATHTALFVLPSGVLPHESIYVDREKRIGGRITISVRQFYENAGTAILDNCIEMPDHIGMQLEFMAFLCNMEKQLLDGSDSSLLNRCLDLQKAFLEEHLSKWADRCCDEIIKQATCGFYKAIADVLKKFLISEREYVVEYHAIERMEEQSVCEASGSV